MPLPQLVPGVSLAAFLAACETVCEHACCGLDAFHFSALNAAAWLSRYTGRIDPAHVRQLQEELDALVASAAVLPADPRGMVCTVSGTNQYFAAADLARLAARIRSALDGAPAVLALSDRLERDHEAGQAGRST